MVNQAELQRTIERMDDATLAFTFFGLHLDDVGRPIAANSETAWAAARMVAFAVADRWIPPEIITAALEELVV